MAEEADRDVALVMNGFLALSMKQKVRLVGIMNDYFDNTDRREGIRSANERYVAGLMNSSSGLTCKCCRQ